jgi:hypothetical protein
MNPGTVGRVFLCDGLDWQRHPAFETLKNELLREDISFDGLFH